MINARRDITFMIIKLDKPTNAKKETFVVPIQKAGDKNKSVIGFNAILEWGKSLKVKSNVPALK
jgi:hypothetical protein